MTNSVVTIIIRRWALFIAFALCGCLTALGDGVELSIGVGSQTTANIVLTTNTWNFAVTTAGAQAGMTMTNVAFQVNRGQKADEPVTMTVYSGLGGTGAKLYTTNIAASTFGGSGYPILNIAVPSLTLSNSGYSVQFSTTASGSGGDFYKFKSGMAAVDQNGNPVSGLNWVQDNTANGTGGTGFNSTDVLADYRLSSTNVAFGNYRLNDTRNSSITLQNTGIATTNNATEKLATVAAQTNGQATINGLYTGLLADGATTNFTVGLNTSRVGTNTGFTTLAFSSSTNGTAAIRTPGAPTNIASQVISVSGVGYRLASDALSSTNVSFGNYRLNSTLSSSVGLTNTAANDGYSEKLSVGTNGVSANLTVSGVPTGLMAAQSNTSLSVRLNTASVGTNTGALTLNFASDGTGVDGFAATNIGSQVVNVSGVGYRLATDAVSATNVNFGNYRINSTLSGNIGLTNTAANDGFSEKLGVGTNGVSANLTVTGVPAGLLTAQSSANLAIGMNSASVGTNTGAFTLNFASDGTGVDGFAATNIGSQVVNVSGVGYRLATDAVSATNVNFGNYRINSTLSGSIGLTNTAANDGFSEKLGVGTNGVSANLTVTGVPAGLLTAQSSANLAIGMNSASVGTNTGALTLNFASNGTGVDGFAATNIGSQVVNVSGVGYRLATAAVSTTNVNFGNYRINSTLSSSVGLTNTAANDGYSEKLSVSDNNVSGNLTVSGAPTGLIAAQSSANLGVGLNSASVGTNTGAFTVNFASNGTGVDGFAATNIGSQVVNVSGVGYRLATAAVSTTNVNFGNYRINSTLSSSVGLTNTAANDGYSEKLSVSDNNVSGNLTVSGAPTGLIAAQSSANLGVGLNSASVGTNTGAFTLNFASNGTGVDGFAATNTGSQVVNVSGVGYRLATVGIGATNINFGSYHIGAALNSSVGLTNTAANDGYSEKLSVSDNNVSGNLTVSGAPTGLIAAQSSANLGVGLNSANVGTNTGAFTVNFASDGTGTSGFGATNIGSQVVNVSGVGYQLATAAVSTTNINLGRIHAGGTFASESLTISNSAAASAYAETLAMGVGATSGGATGSGSVSGLAAGNANNTSLMVNLADNSAGAKSGTVQLTASSQAVGGSGLGTTALAGQAVNVSGFVYTGNSTWNLPGSGSWANYANWGAAGGTPGLDGILSTNDSATFGAGVVGSSATVSLNGSAPTLAALTFSNAAASYTIAAGSGGSLTVGTASSTGTINDLAGNHTISAAVNMAQDTSVGVARSNDTLTIAGDINSNGQLLKTGAGALAMSGQNNTIGGAMLINSGTLSLLGGNLTVGGTLNNAGAVTQVSGQGTFSSVVNAGTWQTSGGVTNTFGGAGLVNTGTIKMQAGDLAVFADTKDGILSDFVNLGANRTAYDTTQGEFLFKGGANQTQEFATAGLDLGPSPTPATPLAKLYTADMFGAGISANNFGLGVLDLAPNSILEISDALPLDGQRAALYLNDLALSAGSKLIVDSNVTVYYYGETGINAADITLLGNGELHQLTTVPFAPLAVPEPGILGLLGLGGVALLIVRRRKK